MKRKILFMIVVSVYTLTTNAQSTRYFEEILGRQNVVENTNVVLQIPGGGYITLGEINQADFIKTDSYGNLIIDSLYYDIDTGYNTLWYDAKLLNDGNLIATGWHNQMNYTNQTDTTEQMWLVKMDTTGQILWSTVVGDSILPTDAYCVGITYDGGYIIGGITEITPVQAIIVKTDGAGNQLWEKRFATGTEPGSVANAIYRFAATPDSGFVFTGSSGDNISVLHTLVRLTKIDKYGSIQIDTSYNISLSYNSEGVSIAVCVDGGYIIGSRVGAGGILFKLNSNDSVVWQTAPFGGGFSMIKLLSDGSIAGCGYISHIGGYASLLIKYDSLGNEIWKREFKFSTSGDEDYAYNFDTTSDGGFILCGRTENPNGADVPFIKTNCLGFVAAPIAAFSDSLGYNGDVFFKNTSQNTDTCYWNWGDGSPIQMVRADSALPVFHHYNSDTIFHVTLIAIACGEVDSITIPIDYITGVNHPNINEKEVYIYPNPNDGSFTIKKLPFMNYELRITDVMGREVYYQALNEPKTQVDVSELSNGVYFYQVRNDKDTFRGKIIVTR